MPALLEWIWAERGWLFSGVGVILIASIISKFGGQRASPSIASTSQAKLLQNEALDPLFVTLNDGHKYLVQVLFSYRVSNPSMLKRNTGNVEKAEAMLQNALRVKATGIFEGQSYSSLASDRDKFGKRILEKMRTTTSKFGMEMLEVDIGSITKIS